MGLWTDHLLPRIIDLGMRGSSFRAERPKCVGRARGRVLEIGFGSGLNLPYYTDEVRELVALEPAAAARKLSARRIVEAPFPVEFVRGEGEELPLDTASFDTVLCTWTLCTIPDVASALREARRVMKPDGRFLFLEHGASRDPKVRRLQDRLTPIQKFWAGGCHFNREIDRLVREAGFETVEVEEYRMPGPAFASSLYLGSARG